MSNLRRYHSGSDTCFVTCVTFERKPILADNFDLMFQSFGTVKERLNFEAVAWVILPDHLHAMFELKGNDLSNVMHRIKLSFASLYRKRAGAYRGRVWQNRFWDHIIRDQDDLNKHIDYIHYNPVKHGLVSSPFHHQFSTIHEYLKNSYYQSDWGVIGKPDLVGEFGE